MGLKIIFHWFGLMSSRIRYEFSQSWNAALCNNRPTTCGEKQQSSRSEQRKGTPLRKRTNKDHFSWVITIWSIGIARRGHNELIFVKTSNLTKTDIFHFFYRSPKFELLYCSYQSLLDFKMRFKCQNQKELYCQVCLHTQKHKKFVLMTGASRGENTDRVQTCI